MTNEERLNKIKESRGSSEPLITKCHVCYKTLIIWHRDIEESDKHYCSKKCKDDE